MKKEDDAVYQMFQEIPAEEDGFENPAHGLSPEEFNDFCRRHVGYSQGIGLKPGYVPDTYYLLFSGDEVLGFAKLRHYLNDFLFESRRPYRLWYSSDVPGPQVRQSHFVRGFKTSAFDVFRAGASYDSRL